DDRDRAVGRGGSRPQHGARPEPALRGQRRAAPAHSSPAAGSAADTSTGSGRMASITRLPADSAAASEVGSWARIVVSPRSTVTRLVAPRNVTEITVPTSGPESSDECDARVTASGRTSAVAGPGDVDRSTSGKSRPRTVTVVPLTVPAS